MINKVKELRFHNGRLTQQQLADKVGVSRQTVIAIEKGTYSPSVRLALKIARTLGVSVEELFILEENESKEV